MKSFVVEHEGCFFIQLEAENVTESSQLVRTGMNSRRDLRHCSAYAKRENDDDGRITLEIVIGKSKKASSQVPK